MFVQVGLICCMKADCDVRALTRRQFRKNSGQRIAYASVALKTYYFIRRSKSILKLETPECQLVIELVEDVLEDLSFVRLPPYQLLLDVDLKNLPSGMCS